MDHPRTDVRFARMDGNGVMMGINGVHVTRQLGQAAGLLRVKTELDVEDIELVMMIQHPRRREHHRGPPLPGHHGLAARYRVIQPHHGIAAGRITQMAYVDMTCGY